ncbi:M48 family metallopeptidase [Streptomyces sp. NPDC005381]|uniref:M48 family metallopeptidase n=1 Tax=Streptomyces sp. NPDC005381 TaxID=3364714 RepID=UPI00368C6CE4
MHTTTEESVRGCPDCGSEIRVHSRFSAWCAACDWNVDPTPPEEKPGRLARARRHRTRRHSERLLAELTAGGALRARRDTASVLTYALALAIHALTVAVVVAGLGFLIRGWGGFGMVPGLLLLGLAWSIRPRLPRLAEDALVLHRADAPELFALVDEVATVVGTRGVDTIAVDDRVNASVGTYGIRNRRLLVLGLPLWEILTPQQRIALLGHELGHYSNGDTRHGWVVGAAYRSLNTWLYFFHPYREPTLLEVVVNAFFTVPRWLLTGLLLLLDLLTLRATQRCEYLADRLAARAGSTEAAVGVLDRLLVSESAEVTLMREANGSALRGRGGSRHDDERIDGLWERLATDLRSVPEHERERQRRAGIRRGHSVDSTHPPTHLRQTALLLAPPVLPAVVSDAGREGRIAAELAGVRRTVARRILLDGYGG